MKLASLLETQIKDLRFVGLKFDHIPSGHPREVNFLTIRECCYLKSLVGCPEIVNNSCYIHFNGNLKSLKGLPKKINENLFLTGCSDKIIDDLWRIPFSIINQTINTDFPENVHELILKYQNGGSRAVLKMQHDLIDLGYMNDENGSS